MPGGDSRGERRVPNSSVAKWSGVHPLHAVLVNDGVVTSRRPASRTTIQEAAAALQKLLDAIEAGELDVSTPKDIALLRRLQGTLAGWEEVLGKDSGEDDHTG